MVEVYTNIGINRFYEAIESQGLNVILSLKNANNGGVPDKFELFQNYPNPFNPRTVISYQLAVSSSVQLEVYNLMGQKVATLVDEKQPAGSYAVEFNASHLSSGVYFYRFLAKPSHPGKAGNYVETRKMVLMK